MCFGTSERRDYPVEVQSVLCPGYTCGVWLGLLNLRPATSIHSLPSEFRAVAATWARAVCTFASSRHHTALEPGFSVGLGFLQEPFGLAVVIWAVHSSPVVRRHLPQRQASSHTSDHAF